MKTLTILPLLFLASFLQTFACDCPLHPGKLTKAKTDSFDVIMRARVELPFPCSGKESQTRFEGLELFKGQKMPRVADITHDCSSACRMPFEKGQEWLLFIHADSAGKNFRATYCERNRPKPADSTKDAYTLYNEMSFDEELLWLRRNMPPAFFLEPEAAQKVLEQDLTVIDQNRAIRYADSQQKILIVVGSFTFMIVLIWMVRRFLK